MCNLPGRAGGRDSPVDGTGLEGAVHRTGDSPLGQVDLEKGKNSKNCKGVSAESFIIALLSVYALCLITLFSCLVIKGVSAYLGQLKDNFVLFNRFQG